MEIRLRRKVSLIEFTQYNAYFTAPEAHACNKCGISFFDAKTLALHATMSHSREAVNRENTTQCAREANRRTLHEVS